jgi:hypothetical protein
MSSLYRSLKVISISSTVIAIAFATLLKGASKQLVPDGLDAEQKKGLLTRLLSGLKAKLGRGLKAKAD